MPSAADYSWFAQDNELINGFSLSWVRGMTPSEIISRLGGKAVRDSDWEHLFEDIDAQPGTRVAITRTGGWSLILDVTAMFGVEEEPLQVLSRGTTVIYQFLNVELDDNYRVLEDGVVRVSFEPYDPNFRQGRAPDELLDAMAGVGFAVGPAASVASSPAEPPDPTQTAFALTEYLTGIRLSPSLLHSQSYLLADFPGR